MGRGMIVEKDLFGNTVLWDYNDYINDAGNTHVVKWLLLYILAFIIISPLVTIIKFNFGEQWVRFDKGREYYCVTWVNPPKTYEDEELELPEYRTPTQERWHKTDEKINVSTTQHLKFKYLSKNTVGNEVFIVPKPQPIGELPPLRY
jgi:hypothetical protein